MASRLFLARAGLSALLLVAGAAASADTTPSQLPLVTAKPAASPQAAPPPPAMAGPAVATDELTPAPQAKPKPADQIKALTGVMRSRDGKTRQFGVSRKLRAIIRGKDKPVVAPQATKIGKFEQIKNTAEYPYSTIGLLGNGCTGTLIGKHFVLTAGYCLYDGKNKTWYENVDFWPGLSGDQQPFGSVKWKNAWVPQGFVDSGADAYNYGLIELEGDIGDKTGWFGFGYDNAFPFKNVSLTGYPGGVAEFTMWQARCSIAKAEPAFLQFNCPVKKQIEGAAGSPVWVKGKDDSSWTVRGIYMGPDGKGYWANRINQSLYETLVSWMTPKEEQPPIGDTEDDEGEEEEGE